VVYNVWVERVFGTGVLVGVGVARRGNKNAVVDGLSGVSEEDIAMIQRLGSMDAADLIVELGLLRLFIRQLAGKDALSVISAVGEAVARLAGVLKAQRVLKGEAAESLAAAMAVALREIAEEMGKAEAVA
jgi:hypothetical protein